jgi:hypothetical protein
VAHLRHTCATALFNRGLSAKPVQTWLGHHSAAFTLSVYVHMLSDELPDADFWDAPGVPWSEEAAAGDSPELGIGLVPAKVRRWVVFRFSLPPGWVGDSRLLGSYVAAAGRTSVGADSVQPWVHSGRRLTRSFPNA